MTSTRWHRHDWINTLQHTATHCNTLQHTTTHCITLQHTEILCNTLQHTTSTRWSGHQLDDLDSFIFHRLDWSMMFLFWFFLFFDCRLFFRQWYENWWHRFDDMLTISTWTLQHTATHCRTLQNTTTHCNTLQRTAKHCKTRHWPDDKWNIPTWTLQHAATHCNTLQHTATHDIDPMTSRLFWHGYRLEVFDYMYFHRLDDIDFIFFPKMSNVISKKKRNGSRSHGIFLKWHRLFCYFVLLM